MCTWPVVIMVSTATRDLGSSLSRESRIASLIWSAILSGCPSVTDSEVNRRRTVPDMGTPRFAAAADLQGLSSSLLTGMANTPDQDRERSPDQSSRWECGP